MASEFSFQDVMNEYYPDGVYPQKYDFVTNVETGDEYWVSSVTSNGIPTLELINHIVNVQETDLIFHNNLPKLTHNPEAFIDVTRVVELTTGGNDLVLGYYIYFSPMVRTGEKTTHYRLFESVSNSVAISANPSSNSHILSDSVSTVLYDTPEGIYRTPDRMLVNKKVPMGSRVILVAYDADNTVISEISINVGYSHARWRGGSTILGIELDSPYISASDPSLIDLRDRTESPTIDDFGLKIIYFKPQVPVTYPIDGMTFRADGLKDLLSLNRDFKGSFLLCLNYTLGVGLHQVRRRYNIIKNATLPPEISDYVEIPEAHWILNELSGGILQDSASGHHAEISGGYSYGKQALTNRDETSIKVTGTATAVTQDTVLLRPGVGDYAISVWLKWDDDSGDINTIFDKSSSGTGPKIYTRSGVYFVIQDDEDDDYKLETYNQYGFVQNILPTHAVFQRRIVSGVAHLEVYLNGLLTDSKELPSITDHSNNAPITLFKDAVGNYSDMHYWANKSFSGNEVLDIYNASSQFQRLPRWLGIPNGNDGVCFNAIVASEYTAGVVIAKTSHQTMTRSVDGGRTFNEIDLSTRPIVSPHIDIFTGRYGESLVNVSNNVWLVSMPGGQIGRTTNNGGTWTWSNHLPGGISGDNIKLNFTVNKTHNVIYAKDHNRNNMFESRNLGVTWSENSLYPPVDLMGVAPSGVMIRSRHTSDVGLIERSTDGGLSWVALDPYLNSGGDRYSKPTFFSHNGVAWVVAMSDNGNNVVSFNDGATWTRSNVKTERPVYGTGSIWFAGNYISTDNGVSWQPYTRPPLSGDVFWEAEGDNFISFAFGGYIGGSVDNLATWQAYPWWANTAPQTYQSGYNRPLMTWVGDAWLLTINAGYISRYTPPRRVS